MKFLLALLLLSLALCQTVIAPGASLKNPLPTDQAFQLSASLKDPQTITLHWHIAAGYYLYRHAFYFRTQQTSEIQLAQPLLPPGITKTIPGIGQFEIYQHNINIGVPIIQSESTSFVLQVHYQGCSQEGYCYPPITKLLPIDLTANPNSSISPLEIDSIPTTLISDNSSSQQKLTQLLNNSNWLIMGFSFFGFGLLLSLTPCVLPMIPILSSIILGQRQQRPSRNFGLSLTYVISMALTYAAAGTLFALLGYSLQVSLQQTWIILLISLILLAMALSLFGFYQLQLPESLRSRVAALSYKQHSGSYWGVAIMGCLSTLIVSPCVTPPLVAALSYISQTGNVAFGAIALFLIGLGMGVPLLIVGVYGPKLLPRSGAWMNGVKNFLGILLLGVVIWLLSRILAPIYIMFLLAALIIGIAVYMGALKTAFNFRHWISKIIGLVLLVYGLMLIFAALQGNTNPLRPLYQLRLSQKTAISQLNFIPVQTMEQIKQQMAKKPHRLVMLDFYADWCLACKQMDLQTFNNPKVVQQLQHYLLLRADVTANSSNDQALQRELTVYGPPTILFFNKHQQEIRSARIIGEISTHLFLQHLQQQVR